MLTAARFVVAVVVAGLALPLGGCSQGSAPLEASPPPTQTGPVVIAQLVTHDAKVSILGSAGTSGPLRVAIHELDGTLAPPCPPDGITLADLQRRDPALYEVVTSSFADGRTYVDATLDLGHLN